MKKIIALLVVLALIFALVACPAPEEPVVDPETDDPNIDVDVTPVPEIPDGVSGKVALVTDVGDIDDKSFNQGTWEGVVAFGEATGVEYKYFRPSEDADEARIETIRNAIDDGATAVVCPGFLFETAIYAVQGDYPDVNFLLIDGEPHTEDYATYFTAPNTHNILFKEEQAGYFAGWAAVMDGFTKLGFCGGMDVPAVVRYGFGYVQGANDAAKEKGNVDDIELKYWYSGVFWPTDDVKAKMASWYGSGTEVVFACGGGLLFSVIAAAEEAGAKVIGVDVDQSAESDLIITSAMKGLTYSTHMSLLALFENDWVWPADFAGQTANLGAADNAVGLPTAAGSWRLSTFSVADYEAIFAKVAAGEIAVSNSIDAPPTVDIAVKYE
ncbi:MAG: BMP family ABC transporter substrate-binding protein [Clostridiales bacterium]|nr:BMP family ABC transporter substrate-binding protein [Clostridiales bacterium]